ncbi:hypothetical protein PG985_008280 [Apiospora marii]|uniref:Uncharacterized protein n=1 Tax=Apiospora marii TaxID=335849 RepID=A0ABR1SRG5_9PEZI
MMPNKSVKYSDGSRPGHKGRHDHDSGVGSLSSEQASAGGRPDRRFTAEDIEHQRRSPRALSEALRAKDEELAQAQQKAAELLADNRKLVSERKTYQKDWQTLCDEKHALQAHVNALKVSNEQLSAEVDKLTTDNYNLKRRQGTNVTAESDYIMSGGLTDSIPIRSRSKRESKQQSPDMDQMKERIRPKDESKSSKNRRRSISSAPGSRKPYIEEQPVEDRSRPPVSYSGQYPNYTTMAPSYTQMQPRTVMDSRSSVTSYQEPTGNYVAHPLPQPPALERRSEHRKRH